jgi:hypothetical protein
MSARNHERRREAEAERRPSDELKPVRGHASSRDLQSLVSHRASQLAAYPAARRSNGPYLANRCVPGSGKTTALRMVAGLEEISEGTISIGDRVVNHIPRPLEEAGAAEWHEWMAVGPQKAIVSHESALALLELSDNIPDHVHLPVPRRNRGLRRPSGVAIHTRPDDEKVGTVWREGIPITTPARTLVDAAGDLQPEQVAMAAQQALALGLLN